jgi:integrase
MWKPFIFVSERGAPLSAPEFSRTIELGAAVAKLGIKAHPHMLRHACASSSADGLDTQALQAYLGHRNIQNTTRYTAPAPDRFRGARLTPYQIGRPTRRQGQRSVGNASAQHRGPTLIVNESSD